MLVDKSVVLLVVIGVDALLDSDRGAVLRKMNYNITVHILIETIHRSVSTFDLI